MKRLVVRLAVLPLLVLLFFILMVSPGIQAAPVTLLLGWWPSMIRLQQSWHPSSTGVTLFVLAVVVLVAGSHAFLQWVYAGLQDRKEWRWKWTVCGHAMLAFALLAICSLVLTIHQLHWITTSSDPLFSDPFREKFGALGAAMKLQKDADALQWNRVKIRESFLQSDFSRFGQPAAETIQPVWIEQDEHSLRAIILIPRRPLHRASARIIILQPGTNFTTHKLDELSQVLASFGIPNPGLKSSPATMLLP